MNVIYFTDLCIYFSFKIGFETNLSLIKRKTRRFTTSKMNTKSPASVLQMSVIKKYGLKAEVRKLISSKIHSNPITKINRKYKMNLKLRIVIYE